MPDVDERPYLTPENSTPGERAAARRAMIAADVAAVRASKGDRAADRLESKLFDLAEKQSLADREGGSPSH